VTEAKAAAIAVEPVVTPSAPTADQSVPSFDIARVEASGDAVIAGRAAPGATVDLLHDGERLDRAVADASGQFVMVPHRLPAGSYELTLSARLPDGTQKSSKQGVSVTVNDTGAASRVTEKTAEYVPETSSQASQPSQPRLQATATKPQGSADVQPERTVAASPASDQAASSPAVARGISTRTVSRGDSLWRISRITYGDGTRYALLYRANREQIRDPNLIHPGQILVVPKRR
jgi:nucleoid-associated protein YgaU